MIEKKDKAEFEMVDFYYREGNRRKIWHINSFRDKIN